MLRLLEAGIVAGKRQIVAAIAITVLAFTLAPDRIAVPIKEVGSDPIDEFAVCMSLALTLAYLVTAVGLALTYDMTVDLTAKRMRHAVRLLGVGDGNMRLAAQLILVALILFSFALGRPPELLIKVSRLLNSPYPAPVIWISTLSVAIAGLGASAHAALRSSSAPRS